MWVLPRVLPLVLRRHLHSLAMPETVALFMQCAILCHCCFCEMSSRRRSRAPALSSTRSARWTRSLAPAPCPHFKPCRPLQMSQHPAGVLRTVCWCFHSESSLLFSQQGTAEPRQRLERTGDPGCDVAWLQVSKAALHLVNTLSHMMPLFLLAVQRRIHPAAHKPVTAKQHMSKGATEGCCSGHPTPAFPGAHQPTKP
jgi:hypothetical protein